MNLVIFNLNCGLIWYFKFKLLNFSNVMNAAGTDDDYDDGFEDIVDD